MRALVAVAPLVVICFTALLIIRMKTRRDERASEVRRLTKENDDLRVTLMEVEQVAVDFQSSSPAMSDLIMMHIRSNRERAKH